LRGPVPGRGFEQLSARYSSCLASIKMRDFPRAERALASAEQLLQALGPEPKAQRLLRYLRAELAQAQARSGEGFAALDGLGREKSRPLLMERSRLALVDSRGGESAREVADELQTWVSLNPKDVLAWSQLGLLWEKLEQPLRAVRAQGEARYAMGDLSGAIDRMRSGLRQSRSQGADPVEASVIDARLRTMLYERRQLLSDMYPRGIPPGAELP